MIRINQIKLPIGHTDEQLQQQICKTLKIRADQLLELHLVKNPLMPGKSHSFFTCMR